MLLLTEDSSPSAEPGGEIFSALVNKKVCVLTRYPRPNDNQRRLAQARQHWQDHPQAQRATADNNTGQYQNNISIPRLPLSLWTSASARAAAGSIPRTPQRMSAYRPSCAEAVWISVSWISKTPIRPRSVGPVPRGKSLLLLLPATLSHASSRSRKNLPLMTPVPPAATESAPL